MRCRTSLDSKEKVACGYTLEPEYQDIRAALDFGARARGVVSALGVVTQSLVETQSDGVGTENGRRYGVRHICDSCAGLSERSGKRATGLVGIDRSSVCVDLPDMTERSCMPFGSPR